MRARSLCGLAVAAAFCGTSTYAANTTPLNPQNDCDPIARLYFFGAKDVVHNSRRLCADERIAPIPGQRLKLLCLKSNQYVMISGSALVGEKCADNAKIYRRENADGSYGEHYRGVFNPERVLRPFGNTIYEPRPGMQWTPVPGASKYVVQLEGYQIKWKERVFNEHELSYPASAPSLKPGDVYKISIIAYSEGKAISSYKSSYQILPETPRAEVNEAIEYLSRLNLPDTEEIIERDALYLSFKLRNLSINTLESELKKSANPRIKELLAQRYTEAGHPDLAERLLATRNSFEITTNFLSRQSHSSGKGGYIQ